MTEFLLKNFPLLEQLDNSLNPYGSCNMTSVAMCLKFLGKSRDLRYSSFNHWADELQQRAEDNGWDRHDPVAMQKMVRLYEAQDDLQVVQGWDKVGSEVYQTIAHIEKGLPAIAHTYLTQSGHIVCLTGVRLGGDGKPTQWHITDPYGEPDIASGTYDRNTNDDPSLGQYWLSHAAFTSKILTDGSFWVHLIK